MSPITFTAAPSAYKSLTFLVKYLRMRSNRPSSSSAGRAKFSVERAYTVRYSMPIAFALRAMAIMAFMPARCPNVRGMNLRFAHLPLPSIMTATWRGMFCISSFIYLKQQNAETLFSKQRMRAVWKIPCSSFVKGGLVEGSTYPSCHFG